MWSCVALCLKCEGSGILASIHSNTLSSVLFQEAIGLLEPMTNDPVNYVRQVNFNIASRLKGILNCLAFISSSYVLKNKDYSLFFQGALIASSLVLIQQTDLSCPKVAKFREIFAKVIGDKHEDIIAKFGATLAQGILDAGK